jgi:hypothetical protein
MFTTPERKAWGVLLVTFAIFCTLAVTVPLSVRWYIANATVAQETALEPIDAAVHVRGPKETEFRAITQSRADISEGTTIVTDEHSRAFLRMFENSTLTMYNDTEVVLSRVRSPRFDASPLANLVHIQVNRGRVAIGAALPIDRALDLSVKTPHADVALEEGSYSISAGPQQTHVTVVRLGQATIAAGEETRSFRSGRCRVVQGMPIEGPLPPEQNLIVNGDFGAVLGSGWQTPVIHRQDESDPFGEAQIAAMNGKTMLQFRRMGARTHGELSTIQYVDKDVRDFTSFKLSCQVQVNFQSLPGGGFESTEFPVMVEFNYRDTFDDARSRHWGFYYLDPGSGPEWRTMVNGIKVIQGEWYLFETENLMQSMNEPPVYIDSVRIYASGWDLDSAITNVALQVQE